MLIEFFGGPRDGDKTHQSYDPPYEYLFPITTAEADYIGAHARTSNLVEGLIYHRYILKHVSKKSSKYVYDGPIKFEKNNNE